MFVPASCTVSEGKRSQSWKPPELLANKANTLTRCFQRFYIVSDASTYLGQMLLCTSRPKYLTDPLFILGRTQPKTPPHDVFALNRETHAI